MVCRKASRNFGTQLLASTIFNPTVNIVATTFFFNALRTPAGLDDATKMFMELAVPMYLNTQPSSPLQLAVEALSLASLSKKFGMRNLDHNASKKYSQALQSLGKTLLDPHQAKSNTTLETILLLSSYEAGSYEEEACQAWASHVEGAAAIVIARGADQIKDKESLTLFRAVREQTLSSVMQQQKLMPAFPYPEGWSMDLNISDTVSIDQAIRLAFLLSKAGPILAFKCTSATIPEVETLLQEARALMQDLPDRDICKKVEWLMQTVAKLLCGKSDLKPVEDMEVWPLPYYHVYKDLDSVYTKNSERLSHMFCSSLVIDTVKWLHSGKAAYKHDHRYLAAKARLQILTDDICASVPYCWYGEDAAVRDGQRTPRQWADAESFGGNRLIWPLLGASTFDKVPERQREWLRGRFVAMSHQYRKKE